MSLKLYNSLTRRVEEFSPLDDKIIRIYTCGPTVYERAHIGNLASFIYADTLKRTLKLAFPHSNIQHVMNITDVDDKTITKSRSEYPDLEPLEALAKLTRHYEDLFKKDLAAVGIKTSDITFVRATENIAAMQALVKTLLEKDVAYIAEDGVYFSISKYEQLGGKYGRLVDITADSRQESRIDNDEYDKDSAYDFALWKRRKSGEPSWDFEANGHSIPGRPGWHIECSAMSTAELGQPFDIHTGGVDLKFPHHENEIAQTKAATGGELANLFFHSEHILVDGKKMSKSLNNFYTLDDIREKSFDPLAFRLLILQSHYRSQAHFSWDNLKAAQNRLKDLRIMQATGDAASSNSQVAQALSNDLDTPAALAADHFGSAFNSVLGIVQGQGELTGEQKALIDQREVARKNHDWTEADRLREELEKQKIGVNDTDDGPVWYQL